MTGVCLRLLLVEDEALIAMMAEDLIETLGHRVVLTAATLGDGMTACTAHDFDAALLDVAKRRIHTQTLERRPEPPGRRFGHQHVGARPDARLGILHEHTAGMQPVAAQIAPPAKIKRELPVLNFSA